MSERLEPALPGHLDEQAERLMHRPGDRKLMVAAAESCTGGMPAAATALCIAKRISDRSAALLSA